VAGDDTLTKDLRAPIVDPPAAAKGAYPITGITFILIPRDNPSTDHEQVDLKNYINYTPVSYTHLQTDDNEHHEQQENLKRVFDGPHSHGCSSPSSITSSNSIVAAFSSIFDTEQYLPLESSTARSAAWRLTRPVTV